MIRLTGSQNPLIKEVRSLKNKRDREEKSLYFIEGTRFTSEAVDERADIRYIVASETFFSGGGSDELIKKIEDAALNCYVVPDSLFASMSDTQSPQGILAVLGLERKQLSDAELSGGLLVILDTIKDPGNMGTIIRTADAAGCVGVIVPDGCVDVFNPKVLRSTMGSVFHLPVYHCGSITEAMNIARKNGFLLCASHLEGSVSIYEADLSGNVAFIIGSEAEGISTETAENSDLLVKIPMPGSAESLNASVAAGVMIFEAMRQNLKKRLP
jgi:TrmH family RNA methyltransferase